MKNYIIYFLVNLTAYFFRLFPLYFSLYIGKTLGFLMYIFYNKRRRIAYSNLKAAFSKKFSPQEIKRINKNCFLNLALTIVEILRIPKLSQEYIKEYIEIEGKENMDKAISKGKGVILVTAHFGNWELLALVEAMIGYPMKVLAREQKHPQLNRMLNRYREAKGCKVVHKGIQIREIIHSLRNNQIVGILVDQDAGRGGIYVDFFNRPTSTPRGLISIASKTGADIIPVFIIRKTGPYHKMVMEEPLELEADVVEESQVDFVRKLEPAKKMRFSDGVNLQKFNRVLEKYIEKYPSQWLWLHKRWKSTPLRNILILNDGKPGHLNQARAVVESIRKALENKFGKLAEIRVKIVDVKYKSFIHKLFLNFGSFLNCQGGMRCVKFALDKVTFSNLIKTYADIIISCGASVAGLNLFMREENNAKSIVLMNPGKFLIGKFDLAVVPAHDRVRPGYNTVITQAALNMINEEYMQDGIETLQAAGCRLQDEKLKIGVLIGGDTKNYLLTKELTDTVLTQILKVAEELDADLLVTTSRRTSKEIDNLIKKRLQNEPRCKLLVIANEKNIEEVVPGILGLSDIIVASGESISMVSEAASSGKRVIVFELEKKSSRRYLRKLTLLVRGKQITSNKLNKHKVFLQNLAESDYITLISPEKFTMIIKKIWIEKRLIKKLNDREIINKAVGKLI